MDPETRIPFSHKNIGDIQEAYNRLLPPPLQFRNNFRIEHGEFQNNNLTSLLSLPSNIDDYAFQNNELTALLPMDSVITIGKNAFAENRLRSLPPMDSLITIGKEAFAGNQLKTLPSMKSLKAISERALPVIR